LADGKITMSADEIAINSKNFKLTSSGTITATDGEIGGWTINSNQQLVSKNKAVVLDSEKQTINVGGTG
jgi:hypothetical protein